MEETLCEKCPKRDTCKAPCKAVNDILWKDNRVMERHYGDKIVCYPRNGEIHFSELDIAGIQDMDDFSMHDVIPWTSEDRRLMKTKVFIERFFKKVPCKDLAAKYGVEENTIVCMYRDAVKALLRIIAQMDARREGLKAVKLRPFTNDQKFFLLTHVFGFNHVEVARMFGQEHKSLCHRMKVMRDKFSSAFREPKKSALDGMTKDQIAERMRI